MEFLNLNKLPNRFLDWKITCKTEHVKLFVNYMNSKHKNIKCTFETGDSNNFSFLDVKITRKNKQLVTSIFHKATFRGVYTNYDSFILKTYKIGLVHTLLFFCFGFSKSVPVRKIFI